MCVQDPAKNGGECTSPQEVTGDVIGLEGPTSTDDIFLGKKQRVIIMAETLYADDFFHRYVEIRVNVVASFQVFE